MAGITLEQAEENLNKWVEADLALAGGAEEYSISIGGSSRTIKKHNAATVKGQVEYWNRWVQRLSRNGRMPVSEVIPR